MSRHLSTERAVRRLCAAIFAYVTILAAIAVVRWHVWTFGADTGTFAQVIADAFGGFRDGPEQGTHFRFHWAPLLALLYPVVRVAGSPLALQFAQIALLASTTLPLYAIAARYTTRSRAVTYATLALLYPPLIAVAFAEFHEIAFYPVVALGLIWAADARRWFAFAAFTLAAVAIREEACLVFAIVGVALAAIGVRTLARGDVRSRATGLLRGEPESPGALVVAGGSLALASAAALVVYVAVVLPRIGAWQPMHFYEYSFATGPLNVVLALLQHPAYLGTFLTFGRLTYVLEAFVPLAFLPVRSRWSLLALPGLAIVLLSSEEIAWRMGSHYAAIFAPWLLLGTVAALLRMHDRRPGGDLVATRTTVALCVVFLIFFNPTHVLHYLKPIYATSDARAALASLPPGVSVATHDEWYTQIALREPGATIFYCPYVQYAVYAADFPSAAYRGEIVPLLDADIASGRARAIARFGAVTVYRRIPTPGARPIDCIRPGDLRYRRPVRHAVIPRRARTS